MSAEMSSSLRYFEDVAEGDALPPLVKAINTVQMMMYGAATWDFMRVHYDTDYARERGFQQAFVDGQMLGAYLAQLVVDWAGDPGALRRLSLRYRNFAFPGDTVTCRGHVTRLLVEGEEAFAECEVVAANQHGDLLAGPALAKVALPRKSA